MTRVNFFDNVTIVRAGVARRAILRNGVPRPGADYLDFGYDYFDNSLLGIGYGGYHYDGRYADAAGAMCEHYGLRQGDRVFEAGCAKGYILVEFHKLGMRVAGVDVSTYAVKHVHPDVRAYVHRGDVQELPFDDDTFDLVFAKDMLAHVSEPGVAVRECMRVSKGAVFFEVQCGRTASELMYMKQWDVTYKTLCTPEDWDRSFQEWGFNGDVHYKVIIPEG